VPEGEREDLESPDGIECRAVRVSAGGAIEDLGITGILRALPATGGRLILLLADERLVLARPDGSIERELAPWAADPWVTEDGTRIAWIALPEGVTEWDFGTETVIAVQDIDAPSPTIVVRDPHATMPRPIPGTRDVLYVSTADGTARLWVAGPGRDPAPLGAVEGDDGGPEMVPFPDRQIAWVPGAIVIAVEPDQSIEGDPWRLYRVALSDGRVAEIGPGRWPRLLQTGGIAAIQPPSSPSCAAIYPLGGMP
jgi:hypothetical protein